MMKLRTLTWLLIIAMLAVTCPAMGEELEIELSDGAAMDISADVALDLEQDPADLAISDEDVGELCVELPELDLSDGLSDALDSGVEANEDASTKLVGSYQPQSGLDNNALFAGYVDMLFGKKDVLGLQSNGFIGDTLTGVAADLYGYLFDEIEKVAAGTLSDTIIIIPEWVIPYSKVNEAVDAISTVIDALLTDCPYHLFWYDKTASTRYGYEDGIYIMFPVAYEFARETYRTNTDKIRSAHVAVTRAKNVVKKYAGYSDYKKLCSYRDYICGAVEYNDDAAADPNWPYGNPWQLIWAFDGDPNTNIVCEGYSKAFQYLCDLSSFNGNIQSHIITGYAQDSGGSGAHMWNIVTMEDGRNYHVDITFVDGGFSQAFLCGAAATQYDNIYCVANQVYYQIDNETTSLYPSSVLNVSTSDYTPGTTVKPKSIKLKKGNTTLKKGQKISLKRGKSLTLKAVVSPGNASTTLTWKSSHRAIVVRNGKVTVNRDARIGTRAKITVKTSNGKSTYIYIVAK